MERATSKASDPAVPPGRFRSGFVGVLGQTNVGKSTLINALLGHKAVIVSDKPQTTRNRIRCILNRPQAQIVFLDTPGLHRPEDKLGDYLLRQALTALEGLDLLLYVVEPWGAPRPYDLRVFSSWPQAPAAGYPRFLVVNKIDRAQEKDVLATLEAYGRLDLFDELVPVSSLRGTNLDRLLALIEAALPEGPAYFPTDRWTDRPLEFLLAELIREQVFQLTHQEIPYAVAVEVEEVREREDKPLLEIYATIDVARPSQRGILIGRGGQMIKRIGRRARAHIEALLGTQVYLDLQVRVKEKWNQDPAQIQRLLGPDA